MNAVFRSLLLAVALSALGLSACGIRGNVEPPPDQVLPKNKDGKPVDPGVEKPKRSFFLDPLLN